MAELWQGDCLELMSDIEYNSEIGRFVNKCVRDYELIYLKRVKVQKRGYSNVCNKTRK